MLDASAAAQPFLHAGSLKYQQGDLLAAREDFQNAISVQPDLTPALFNLGVICRDLEENDEAKKFFHDVLHRGEIVAESHNNLGILDARDEAFQDAEARYRKAIDLKPDFALAHFNLANVLLRTEQWSEGWREYEWRWQTPTFTPLDCPQPRWQGQELDGTLLLHTEQGIGDTLQFARFIPLIHERCKRLIFVRPDHLGCLFQAGDWADEVQGAGQIDLDSFDAVLPLMSAPLALGIHSTEQIASQAETHHSGYMNFPRRSITLPKARTDDKIRIGISWRGSPTYSNDRFRSTALETFAPLLQNPRIELYSLHVGEAAEELRQSEWSNQIIDTSPMQSDLADAAAIIQQLDVVLSVDTAMLHLGASMGVPTWGLLSRRGDWRWLDRNRLDSPWYPSVRLFRQRSLNDWAELITRVRNELEQAFPG